MISVFSQAILACILSVSRVASLIPTTIMLSGSAGWNLELTPFETIVLFIVFINIALLRILEILPVDINKLLHSDPNGRRKRREANTCGQLDHTFDSLLVNIIKKIDRDECGWKFICQLKLEYNLLKQNQAFSEESINTGLFLNRLEQASSLQELPMFNSIELLQNGTAKDCREHFIRCPSFFDNKFFTQELNMLLGHSSLIFNSCD